MPTATMLQAIAAAVTPVVFISAAAVLILGINQRHTGLADRIRALTQELRYSSPSPRRRQNIRAQLQVLSRRVDYAGMAHRWLYFSVVSFTFMVLVMGVASQTGSLGAVVLALFLIGMLLILAAVLTELLDLRMAGMSIRLEVQDALAGDGESPRPEA